MAGMARRRTSSQPSAPTSHRRSLVSRTFKRPVDASQIATRQRAQQLGRPQWRWSTIGRSLSLDAKRSILINWTWIEHLIDQAPDEHIERLSAFTSKGGRRGAPRPSAACGVRCGHGLLVVFDCERFQPSRFALVTAAAARSRALRRGREAPAAAERKHERPCAARDCGGHVHSG